jgi:hypothetical protein
VAPSEPRPTEPRPTDRVLAIGRLRFQPRHQLIFQPKLLGDLIGLHKNRLGLRGVLARQVLEVLGDRTVIQVEMVQVEVDEAIGDPGRKSRECEA